MKTSFDSDPRLQSELLEQQGQLGLGVRNGHQNGHQIPDSVRPRWRGPLIAYYSLSLRNLPEIFCGCVNNMNTRYRLTSRGVRGGMFYCVDKTTGKRTSLQTTNKDEAQQIIEAKNNSVRQPVLNLQIAKPPPILLSAGHAVALSPTIPKEAAFWIV